MLDPANPSRWCCQAAGTCRSSYANSFRWDFTRFAGCLKGGMEAWLAASLPVQGLAQLPIQELNKVLPPRDFQSLDVRTPHEWNEGHLTGARYLFLGELSEKVRELNPQKPVVVYCATGYRSSLAPNRTCHVKLPISTDDPLARYAAANHARWPELEGAPAILLPLL
jgi:hydroxyacylglutathione hydrolase